MGQMLKLIGQLLETNGTSLKEVGQLLQTNGQPDENTVGRLVNKCLCSFCHFLHRLVIHEDPLWENKTTEKLDRKKQTITWFHNIIQTKVASQIQLQKSIVE